MKVVTDEQIDSAYREVWSTVTHEKRLASFAKKIAVQAVLEERERNAKLCQENEVWMSADKGMVLRPNLPIAGHEHVGFAYAAAIRAQPEPEA